MISGSYTTLLKRGTRIALRAKVNDNLITGMRLVDALLPIGRGQRQLILGDRNTGKTTIFMTTLFACNLYNSIATVDGFGAKRIFGIYIGIQTNLSKLSILVNMIRH
jgi:F-type H+-transporting ATPase subunit alpha